jgi:hypothetical protein
VWDAGGEPDRSCFGGPARKSFRKAIATLMTNLQLTISLQRWRSKSVNPSKPLTCPDCDGVTRRDFLKTAGGTLIAAAAGGIPVFAMPRLADAAVDPKASRETLVATLYNSLSPDLKAKICFPWEHERRLMISNNWSIVPQTIGADFTGEQQEIIRAIFNACHSEEWIPKKLQQMKDDAGSFDKYNVAMFGSPGAGKFEWVMTGRHMTLRVDGNSEPGVAFGGPIFYGHAAQGFNEKPDHPGNVYWHQAVRANEVYQALDGKQREKALVAGPVPAENPGVLLARPKEQRAGLSVSEMSKDQQEMVTKVLHDLMAPYSKVDQAEAEKYLRANGGVKSLNMAFHKEGNIGDDDVWDVWRLEGPAMTWYFRGSPHVHVWVYLSEKPLTVTYPSPRATQ